MTETTAFTHPIPKGYQVLSYEIFQQLLPIQQLQVIQGMHAIVHKAHDAGFILSDLALDRFAIKKTKDTIKVEYQGNDNSITQLNKKSIPTIAKADMRALGETFKMLHLNPVLISVMTNPESEKRISDEQLAHKFNELLSKTAAHVPTETRKNRSP